MVNQNMVDRYIPEKDTPVEVSQLKVLKSVGIDVTSALDPIKPIEIVTSAVNTRAASGVQATASFLQPGYNRESDLSLIQITIQEPFAMHDDSSIETTVYPYPEPIPSPAPPTNFDLPISDEHPFPIDETIPTGDPVNLSPPASTIPKPSDIQTTKVNWLLLLGLAAGAWLIFKNLKGR